MDETKTLVGWIKTRIPDADLGKFSWDSTDTDQGNFEFKMMVFRCFNDDVIPRERKRVQLDIQQALKLRSVEIRRCNVRATLEISADSRPWNKAQAVFLETMREIAGLGRDAFDIGWISTGIRVAAGCPSQLASITIGATWVVNRKREIQDFGAKCGF